jgi:hypothetical protein
VRKLLILFWIRGIDNILFRSGLIFSYVLSKEATSDLTSYEYVVGRGLKAPLTIFIAKKCRLGASKGGFKANISYKMTPIDHISDLKLYGLD